MQEAEHITQLFEFNTRPVMASEALRLFVSFWGNPEEIDNVIDQLEEARMRAFEEASDAN